MSSVREGLTREVEIWPVWLRGGTRALAIAEAILSDEENETAGRRRGSLREDYMLAHAGLRVLLGAYLSVPPSAVVYSFGPNGKPRLRDDPDRLCFNLSHSGGLAVYGFTEGCELGIDIEKIRPLPELDTIAQRYFAEGEAKMLAQAGEDDQVQRFFRCWTRKEAYLKGEGGGLSIPLDSFEVALCANRPALLHIGGNRDAGAAWTLHNLKMPPGFTGCLAYRDFPRSLRLQDISDAGSLIESFHRLESA